MHVGWFSIVWDSFISSQPAAQYSKEQTATSVQVGIKAILHPSDSLFQNARVAVRPKQLWHILHLCLAALFKKIFKAGQPSWEYQVQLITASAPPSGCLMEVKLRLSMPDTEWVFSLVPSTLKIMAVRWELEGGDCDCPTDAEETGWTPAHYLKPVIPAHPHFPELMRQGNFTEHANTRFVLRKAGFKMPVWLPIIAL